MFGSNKQNQTLPPEAKPEPLHQYSRKSFDDAPSWTRDTQELPRKKPFRHRFNPLLLVGLGSDGAQILNQIVHGFGDLYPDAQWEEAIHLTAVGVDSLSPLPKKLDPRIRVLDLQPNFDIFSLKQAGSHNRYDLPYLDWWYNANEPTRERGGARMSIFTHLRGGFGDASLYRALLKSKSEPPITRTYIITSLSDVVGTALMWDVLHMISRNVDLSVSPNFTVMWLATVGSDTEHETEHAAAWHELLRLSVPRSILSHFNEMDVLQNKSLTVSGAARTILCGNAGDSLDRIERGTNSLALTADCILSTLDPAFSQHFDEWLNQPVPSARDFAPTITTMGTAVYWFPTNRFREIAELHLINNLLFGQIGNIKGLIPIKSDEVTGIALPEIPAEFSASQWGVHLLRGIKWNPRFFERVAAFADHHTTSNMTALGKLGAAPVDDFGAAYRDALMVRLDQTLNGDTTARGNIRQAMTAKLMSAHSAVKELAKLWTDLMRPIYLGQLGYDPVFARKIVTTCRDISLEMLDLLGDWSMAILGINSEGEQVTRPGEPTLRRIVQDQFNRALVELQKEYLECPPHRIMLGNKSAQSSEPRKMADASKSWAEDKYKEWVAHLVNLEAQSRSGSDPLGTIYSRIGWWVGTVPGETDAEIKLCVMLPNDENPTQDVLHSFSPYQLMSAVRALRQLVNPFGAEVFRTFQLNTHLPDHNSRSLRDQIEQVGNPLILRGDSIKDSYVLTRDQNLATIQADSLRMVGWDIKPLSSEATPADRISYVRIKSQVESQKLFAQTPRPRKISAYVFAAEQKTTQIEQAVQGKDYRLMYRMPAQFVYLLSDSELAELFAKCLLYELLVIDTNGQGIWPCDNQLPVLGGAGNWLLYYQANPLLRAMEDFVIRHPGTTLDQQDLLHPLNRKALIEHLNAELASKRGNTGKDQLLKTFERLSTEHADSGGHLQDAMKGFFSWFQVIAKEEASRL